MSQLSGAPGGARIHHQRKNAINDEKKDEKQVNIIKQYITFIPYLLHPITSSYIIDYPITHHILLIGCPFFFFFMICDTHIDDVFVV